MQQVPIFAGDEEAHLLGVRADVEAAGGLQSVGHRLSYHADPIQAGKILSNKLSVNQHKHVLSAWDEKLIRRWVREKGGIPQSFVDEAGVLNADVKWKSREEIFQEQIARQRSAREAWEEESRRTEELFKKFAEAEGKR